jgi:NAD-dependent DNA ligase
MFLNPVQVESIEVKEATFLNANEVKKTYLYYYLKK